jgi:hypothetical protein
MDRKMTVKMRVKMKVRRRRTKKIAMVIALSGGNREGALCHE